MKRYECVVKENGLIVAKDIRSSETVWTAARDFAAEFGVALGWKHFSEHEVLVQWEEGASRIVSVIVRFEVYAQLVRMKELAQ
ncbi:MAG: hypothetical protein EOM24_04725 [Chloroflexia bacterium]|nr:hypothetical protein [Chloroflexia bacterium]